MHNNMSFTKLLRLTGSILSCLILLGIGQLMGQDGPESSIPSGFGINQYQVSENLSSGVLNINLPIESSIAPISIGYATTGIRVNQRPGLLGLGWNLNAGGYIMRQKRGYADDHEQGYSGENRRGTAVSTNPSAANFGHLVGSRGTGVPQGNTTPFDTEPDIYQFQFLGQSGTFTISSNTSRDIVKLSANNLKIEHDFDNVVSNKYESFTITDEAGNQYLFDIKEQARVIVDGNEVEAYTHKWYLKEVTFYQTGEKMVLAYNSYQNHTESNPFRSSRWTIHVTPTLQNRHSNEDLTVEIEYTQPKYLSTITYNDSYVQFVYGSRTDITTTQKLNEIRLFRNGGQVVSYNFNYTYLGESGANRLMLSSVDKSNLDVFLFQFEYFGQSETEPTLPPYNDPAQDHWGFHNNNAQSTLYEVLGANRVPSIVYAQANSLKKVYDATGAYEQFQYELNDYRENGINHLGGGLRIKSITKRDINNLLYPVKSYSYVVPNTANSSGELYAEPGYRFDYIDESWDLREYQEHSINKLYDDVGRHITYEYVTIEDITGSKTQHKFKTFTDERTLFGTGAEPSGIYRSTRAYVRSSQSYTTATEVTLSMDGPFGYRNFKGVAAGLLEEKIVKDASQNMLLKEVYSYVHIPPATPVRGFNFLRQAYRRSGNVRTDEYLVSVYELGYGYMLNNRVKTTAYDRNNVVDFRTTVADVIYEAGHPLPKEQLSYLEGEIAEARKTQTDYYFQQSGIPSQVNDNNLKALVSETRSYIAGNLVAKNTTSYNTASNGGKVAPWAEYNYVNNQLTGYSEFYYREGIVNFVRDGNSGYGAAKVYDDQGRVVADATNVTSAGQIAFHSFESDDMFSGWTVPTLNHGNCGFLNDCDQQCQDDAQCEAACDSQNDSILACIQATNLEPGYIDKFAFDLSSANITKSLTSGTYRLTFWRQSGTATISGESSKTLLKNYTKDGWTFELWEIIFNSAGTITLSGSGHIDQLGISPKNARMSINIYDDFFGVSAQMDAAGNYIYYEYDAAGRQIATKDRSGDIVSQTAYHLAGYLSSSQGSFSTTYEATDKIIHVLANKDWTVSKPGWITVNRTTNAPVDQLNVTVQANGSSSARSGTISLSGTGLPTKNIVVSQGGQPNASLSVPSSVVLNPISGSVAVSVTSNINWLVSVYMESNPGDLTLSTSSGSNNGQFTITYAPNQPGPSMSSEGLLTGTIKVTGGNITKYITVSYGQL